MTKKAQLIHHITTSPSTNDRPWILLCPFAGTSRSAFVSTAQNSDLSNFALSIAIYPGHDHRMNELPHTNIATLADKLVDELTALPHQWDDRLILAGHSMGAQVAFEAVLRLQARNRAPAGLVLSGCQAPHLRGRRLLSNLSDHRFIDELIEIGGCDARLRGEPQLLSVFMPMLRADFLATENYLRPLQDTTKGVRSHVPTLLICGSHDTEASSEEVLAWKHWIVSDFAFQTINGNHFYVTQQTNVFTDLILDFYHQRILRKV